MSSIEALRVLLIVVWLISPLFLAVLAMLRSRRPWADGLGTGRFGRLLVVAAVANWTLFITLLIKAQFHSGAIFQTSALTQTLLFLSCFGAVGSLVSSRSRWLLFFANFLLMTIWVAIVYAPAHWLEKWDYGKVTIDGHPTSASIFVAHPWDSEADTIVFVRVPAASDYFLSFDEEKVRLARKHEYVRLPGGVWCLPSLREMAFAEPLSPHRLNEFRIASRQGGVVSVQF